MPGKKQGKYITSDWREFSDSDKKGKFGSCGIDKEQVKVEDVNRFLHYNGKGYRLKSKTLLYDTMNDDYIRITDPQQALDHFDDCDQFQKEYFSGEKKKFIVPDYRHWSKMQLIESLISESPKEERDQLRIKYQKEQEALSQKRLEKRIVKNIKKSQKIK